MASAEWQRLLFELEKARQAFEWAVAPKDVDLATFQLLAAETAVDRYLSLERNSLAKAS